MNTYQKGKEGEEKAAEILIKMGHEIIKRNFKCLRGEVDIICIKGKVLKFVEVKNWYSLPISEMEYAVGNRKQNRIIYASKQFLKENQKYAGFQIQYDVLWISNTEGKTVYIESAFTETGAA